MVCNLIYRIRGLLILGAFIFSAGIAQAKDVSTTLPSNYYPYANKIADIYVGVRFASVADVSTYTAGNPKWGALYNPMALLDNYGASFMIGLRPFNKIIFLRDFRIEAETDYIESRYDILQDTTKNAWVDKKTVPPYGKITLSKSALFNVYYDVRWLSQVFYPYFGIGTGLAKVEVRSIDFSLLPCGMGEEYGGSKDNVPVTQFIAGLQYDTKIIKSSVFVEYRYQSTSKVHVTPKYRGDEDQQNDDDPDNKDKKKDDDKDKPKPLPPDFHPSEPRDIAFKGHSIAFGIKFYLY